VHQTVFLKLFSKTYHPKLVYWCVCVTWCKHALGCECTLSLSVKSSHWRAWHSLCIHMCTCVFCHSVSQNDNTPAVLPLRLHLCLCQPAHLFLEQCLCTSYTCNLHVVSHTALGGADLQFRCLCRLVKATANGSDRHIYWEISAGKSSLPVLLDWSMLPGLLLTALSILKICALPFSIMRGDRVTPCTLWESQANCLSYCCGDKSQPLRIIIKMCLLSGFLVPLSIYPSKCSSCTLQKRLQQKT
jgi:hypothetical protein